MTSTLSDNIQSLSRNPFLLVKFENDAYNAFLSHTAPTCVCLCVRMHACYSLSRVQLFTTPRTVARQAPLSMEFSRQEYWSGLPFPSPGDLPTPGIEPRSPALQGDSLLSEPQLQKLRSCAKTSPLLG